MSKIRHYWTDVLLERLKEKPKRIQILLGPRQVGKSTSLKQIASELGENCILASADDQQRLGPLWIEQQWELARRKLGQGSGPIYLLLDEIQKISNWSETVKKFWDQESQGRRNLHVVLSGSSSLGIQDGLSESLAGRFEVVHALHGTWPEFKKLTKKSFDHYVFFGGYPGSLDLLDREERWRDYVNLSIIEAVMARDILSLTRVNKPALLRQLFHLGCEYSGQIFSYQKALGQLNDAGNTVTLSHYLKLTDQAFLLRGLEKYGKSPLEKRASSPKYQVHNTALISALGLNTFDHARADSQAWGHLVESSVGAYLVNQSRRYGFELHYWRDGNAEVDFVVSAGKKNLLAIEVKSGRRGKLEGLKKFKGKYSFAKTLVLETSNGSLQEFMENSPLDYL